MGQWNMSGVTENVSGDEYGSMEHVWSDRKRMGSLIWVNGTCLERPKTYREMKMGQWNMSGVTENVSGA